jgi:antitoxin component of MazEF toxin-antitoxin module
MQKWGSLLVLRIPKRLGAHAGLRPDSPVAPSLVDAAPLLEPVLLPPPTLAELLIGVTDENIPGEWDSGPGRGRALEGD